MRRLELGALAAASALAAFAVTAEASAYCRTSSCPDVGTATVCTPAMTGDCGTPLFWAGPCVSFSVQLDASSQVSLAVTQEIFNEAFATWTGADCGDGAHPHIKLNTTQPVTCEKHEYNQDKGNANIIAYRDGGWPHAGGASTLALTTVTYNLDTGEIYDADMELNSADNTFSTGDENVTFDLLSIATHETGHFLGLAHSQEQDATMFANYVPGSIELRTLHEDDTAAICAVYPPGEPIDACDSTPRHGFSGDCAEDQATEVDGCAAAPVGRGAGGREAAPAALALAALLAGAAARRGRRRERRPEGAPR